MSTSIHIACSDCREHMCIGQVARGEAGAPDWVNVYAGPQFGVEDATDKFGRFVTKHLNHRLTFQHDELVFDAMYAEFEDKRLGPVAMAERQAPVDIGGDDSWTTVKPTIQGRLDAVLAQLDQTMEDMRAQGIVHFRTTWSEDDQQFVMEGSPVPFPPDEDDHFPIGTPYYARPSK